MLLLLGVGMLAPNIIYATPNQSATENFANTTNVSEITENNTNTYTIQNTTTSVVNDSDTNQKLNHTSETINSTQNSSSDNSNRTETIQNNTAAASDGFQNVHALWISADEVSAVNLNELLNAGITDIFVKTNRFSSPNYNTVLTAILSKLNGTGIRVHAWVSCFIDENGKWVDPLGKTIKTTVKVPYTKTVKVATKNWYKSWYKVWYKSWYKYRGVWRYSWKSYWNYQWKYYWSYSYKTTTEYTTKTITTTDTSFNDALVNYIASLAKNYDIDGIHLDYVRYPGTAYKHSGGTDAITNFVKKVDETLYSISPKISISASLMPECSVNGYYYGQDYAELSKYLDFLVPMIYKGNYNKNTAWIGTTTKWIVEHSNKPVVAGLQIYESDSNVVKLPTSEINQDIQSAISNGASGYALFRYGLIDKAFFHQTTTTPSTTNTTSNTATTTNGTSTNNNSSTSNSQPTCTIADIIGAAGRVKSYVETNKVLPNYVQIGSLQVSMPQFLRLLATCVLQVKDGVSTPIVLKSISKAPEPCEAMTNGNLDKSEYLDLAGRVKSYMDVNGAAPNYGSTTLGKIRYESLVYLFSRVVAFYGNEKYLPNYAVMKPWNSIASTTSNSQPTCTIADIIGAAGRVKSYVETNKVLPNYVQIGSLQVSMPQFLRLLATCVLQVKDGVSTPIVLKSISKAPEPCEAMTNGNLDKSEYLDLAGRVKSYMDVNGAAPNYGSTTLGKIRYESLVYLFSRVVAFYGNEKYLPNYAVMKPWSSISSGGTSTPTETIPSSLQIYLQTTANCQVNNPNIIALAQNITSGATSSYDKATRIFNWVRDNLEYSFYYNTEKGAVQTLSSRSGNCCDHSHLIVALSRAAGLPARYVHGNCYFTTSKTWYGHVWAEIYANGIWYTADGTSYRNSLGSVKSWDTSTWTKKGTYTELPF